MAKMNELESTVGHHSRPLRLTVIRSCFAQWCGALATVRCAGCGNWYCAEDCRAPLARLADFPWLGYLVAKLPRAEMRQPLCAGCFGILLAHGAMQVARAAHKWPSGTGAIIYSLATYRALRSLTHDAIGPSSRPP